MHIISVRTNNPYPLLLAGLGFLLWGLVANLGWLVLGGAVVIGLVYAATRPRRTGARSSGSSDSGPVYFGDNDRSSDDRRDDNRNDDNPSDNDSAGDAGGDGGGGD